MGRRKGTFVEDANSNKEQLWRLPFIIDHYQLQEDIEYQDEKLALDLKPLPGNNIEGVLLFQIVAPEADQGEAEHQGQLLLQCFLREGFLAFAGKNLEIQYGPIEFVNRKEFKGKVRIISDRKVLTIHLLREMKVNEIHKTGELLKRIDHSSYSNALKRCFEWLRKGEDAPDAVDKFIMYWVAFNIVYGLIGRKSDATLITELLNTRYKSENISNILSNYDSTIRTLTSLELKSWGHRRNFSHELAVALESRDDRRKISQVVLCLYTIRNQLFHAGLVPIQDRVFMNNCVSLLKAIIRDVLISHLGMSLENIDQEWFPRVDHRLDNNQ
jgi:hypothetical protein